MRTLGSRILAVLAAALMLIGASEVASYAATGHSLLLGKVNKATKVTTVTRTAAGPAMIFKTKPGSAPFGVGSATKVGNLNADRLDGLDSSALQTRTRTFTDSGEQDRGNSEVWSLPVGPGSYQVSYMAPLVLSAGTAAAPETVACNFQTGAAAYAMQSGMRVAVDTQPFLSGAGSLTVAPGGTLVFACNVSGATHFELTDGGTVRIDVTRIDDHTVSTIAGHD